MAIFVFFLVAKMVNLDAINFQLGLPLYMFGNDGKQQSEVHISKMWPKWQMFGPK